MDTAIQYLLEIRAVEPVPIEQQGNGYYYMLFVIQKAWGRGRLQPVLNLKGMNKFLRYRWFKMCSL